MSDFRKTSRRSRWIRNLGAGLTAVLAWISLWAALSIALLPTLDERYRSPESWPLAGELWPPGVPGHVTAAVLLAAFFLIFLGLTRRQLNSNPYLRRGAGCPNCASPYLVRVNAPRSYQYYSRLTRLPLGRYVCRDCSWEGVRTTGFLPFADDYDKPESEAAAVYWVQTQRMNAIVDTAQPQMQPRMAAALASGTAVFEAAPALSTAKPDALERIDRISEHSLAVAIFYLLALTIAEYTAVVISPVTGVVLHILILFTLALHAAFTWDRPLHRFLLALMLVPLVRVVSLSLPLAEFNLTYWFFITSVPLFGAAYVVMRELNFTLKEAVGFSWRGLPLQLLIGAGGILLGLTEYLILKPEPLVASLSWSEAWLPAIILIVSTGFLEEYIFRFLLQRTSIERLGVFRGIVYVALLFAVLHIGYHSALDFIFVFAAGWLFGVIAFRTRSILGVTIAHGLTNICLFLIFPFILAGQLGPLPQLRALVERVDFSLEISVPDDAGSDPVPGLPTYLPDGADTPRFQQELQELWRSFTESIAPHQTVDPSPPDTP